MRFTYLLNASAITTTRQETHFRVDHRDDTLASYNLVLKHQSWSAPTLTVHAGAKI